MTAASTIATTVLVVGAGPVGLAAAKVLARSGVATLVVEREAEVAAEPRAVSIDDEAMRLLQSVGLAGRAAPTVMPGTGTRYYGIGGRLLAAASPPALPAYGFPIKNPIDHAGFTRLLLDAAAEDGADVRLGHELVRLAVGDEGATAGVRGPDGRELTVTARWVLGCDGGRSTTRKLLGIEMRGRSVDEPWLIVDTRDDPHAERYAMHHGDPARPHVILPGGGGRCRYEFRLRPGEEADAASFELARRLLAPYRPDLRPEHIVRQRVYVFHALVAAAWRRGPAFLLGDAAHMMPPFAGQGLNTGLRDAANLAWKLAAVIRGDLGEQVLETYERERRPHAEAMVAMSVRRGRVVMTTSPVKARARDAAALLARRVPPLRRRLERLPIKPPARFGDGLLVRLGDDAPGIVGAMLPQPRVLGADGRLVRLDEVLGPGFALVTTGPADLLRSLADPAWSRLGARRVRVLVDQRFPPAPDPSGPVTVADDDGLLAPALADCGGLVLVVRPDRFVLGAFVPRHEQAFLAAWSRLGGPAGAAPQTAGNNGAGPDRAAQPLGSMT